MSRKCRIKPELRKLLRDSHPKSEAFIIKALGWDTQKDKGNKAWSRLFNHEGSSTTRIKNVITIINNLAETEGIHFRLSFPSDVDFIQKISEENLLKCLEILGWDRKRLTKETNLDISRIIKLCEAPENELMAIENCLNTAASSKQSLPSLRLDDADGNALNDHHSPSQASCNAGQESAEVASSDSLEDLMLWSFGYCLDRFEEPDATSSTRWIMFGPAAGDKNASPNPYAVILGIRTELDHLVGELKGDKHNQGKPDQQSVQLADEIVDMLRHLFILAIVNGFRSYEKIDWHEQFTKGFSDPEESEPGPLERLWDLYDELIVTVRGRATPELSDWIDKMLRTLGDFAQNNKVALDLIQADFADRKQESLGNIEKPTTENSRIQLPKVGAYALIAAVIEDVETSYSQLLGRLSAEGFNVWSSATHIFVPGESACVYLLVRVPKKSSTRERLEKKLDLIRSDFLETKDGSRSRHLVASIVQLMDEPRVWSEQEVDTPQKSRDLVLQGLERFREFAGEKPFGGILFV